ncbi:MAG: 2,4-dihydroxyhept-2-ene-1,7-dioic acid aldolase [Candidatus Omnitrophica bacterium]|nr:2,4-dihydroxyhept-2-ene-1,7-dioic acid aldolase [Candidatus Omnitrophota bacterium]
MKLRDDLRKRRCTIGSWLTIGDESVAEIMARSGFDWLVVDMEHSAITIESAQKLIRTIDLAGVMPLVRVGENDPALIKRVMDAGAYGVVVPMVNCRSDAERAVRAVRYPPLGTRGVGLARAQGYGFSFQEYLDRINRESVVIAQIEHIDAVRNLESILTVEGVDGSIIGPYDLSGSLGHPGEFANPAVKKALAEYERICRKLQKPMGSHVVQPDPELARSLRKRGYSFIAVGIDMLYLGTKARESAREAKR